MEEAATYINHVLPVLGVGYLGQDPAAVVTLARYGLTLTLTRTVL